MVGCEAAGSGGTGCDVAPVGVIAREGGDAAGGEDIGAGIPGCEAGDACSHGSGSGCDLAYAGTADREDGSADTPGRIPACAEACSPGPGSGLAYVGVAGRKDVGVGAARWAVGGVDGCSHGFGSGVACGGFLGCGVVGAEATGSGLVSGFWLCGVERSRGGGGRLVGLVAGSRDPGVLPMPQGGLPMRRRGRRAGAVIDRSRASAMARSAIGSGVRTSATVWGGWPWEWGRAAFWG